MLQLQILSGQQADFLWEARRFPVRVGRAEGNDLRLEADGIWAEHFQINCDAATGFSLTVQPGALVAVNKLPVETVHLRNGDIITAGAAKICFRLSTTRQTSLRLREALVWIIIIGVSLGQIALISWLLQ